MTVTLIVGFAISIIIQVSTTWYLAYIKADANQVAIKNHIDRITKITETIKSELNVLTQRQIGIDVLKRNAILEFNDALYVAINGTLNLRGRENPTDEDYLRYVLAKGRLKLFIDEGDLNAQLEEIHELLEEMFIASSNLNSKFNATKTFDHKEVKNLSDRSIEISHAHEKLTSMLRLLL